MWHYFWAHRVYHCSRACPKHRARKCPLWVMCCGLSELWCWDVVYMWWSCGVTWGHVTSCDVTRGHVMVMWPRDVTRGHVMVMWPRDTMWCYKRSCDGHVTSCDTMWCYKRSCDGHVTLWCYKRSCDGHVTSCDTMWCYKRSCDVIGASLSEPHTSVTALLDTCVCVYVCLCVAIYRKFKLSERVSILHVLKRIHVRWTMVN